MPEGLLASSHHDGTSAHGTIHVLGDDTTIHTHIQQKTHENDGSYVGITISRDRYASWN